MCCYISIFILQLAAAIQQEKQRHEKELRALEQRLKESFVMVSETKLLLTFLLKELKYGKGSKILNCSSLLQRSRQTVHTHIRLFLKKQSYQGLPYFTLF